MRRVILAGLCAALLAIPLSTAHAQRGAQRRGLWLGGGLGLGSGKLSCSVCRSDRSSGTAGYLRVGLTVSKAVLVGVEADGWYKSQDQVDQMLTAVHAVAFLYPRPSSGLFVKAGLGISQFSAKDDRDKVSSQALSIQVGAGYEMLLGHSFSVVPYLTFLGSTGGDVRFNNTVSSTLSANTSLIQAGIGLTLH